MSVEVGRLAPDDEAGIATFIAINNAVTPDDPVTLEHIRWEDRTYPGQGERLVGVLDGRTVGVASVGRVRVRGPEYERYWLALRVLSEARRRGIGGALYAAASTIAREAGKVGFQTMLSEREADGLAFLRHRGFEVISREKMVELDLRGRPLPAIEPPAGIEITSLAARPELARAVHAVAEEAYPDIPSRDEPLDARPFEEWLARDVARETIPAGAFAIAIDSASDEVVGYASLEFIGDSTTRAWHDMTGVRRRWRGRGVARALKLATIAWAIEHGLETLVTGNDEDNAPMRAVNARLGYTPIADELSLHGPLAAAGEPG